MKEGKEKEKKKRKVERKVELSDGSWIMDHGWDPSAIRTAPCRA